MSAATTTTTNNTTTASNPGNVLASAVDAEIAKFRALQNELQQVRQDLSLVMGQETENEMVLMELEVIQDDDDSKVFKQLGPILLRQDLAEAKQTVQKRLEFIRSEKKRLEQKVTDTEERGNALAQKIQRMQAGLQQTTADAVRAIAQQHGGTAS